MLYTDLTKQAIKLCFDAHKDQLDKSGLPYVLHPFHLAELMKDEYSTVAALLHDVMEDTDYTLDDLKAMGYPKDILDALVLLTHIPGTPYFEYVANIRNNPIAKAVKLADLKHNSDLSRLSKVTQADLNRAEKYAKAICILEDNS